MTASGRALAGAVLALAVGAAMATIGSTALAATPTPGATGSPGVSVSVSASPSAAASPGPARIPTVAGPATFTVSCDNGSTYTRQVAGDGSTTIAGLPAGTVCTALQQPVGPGQTAAPVPGGGQVRLDFGAPSLALTPAVGRPGFTTQVNGVDFPPNATVALAWSVGAGGTTVVVTDGSGNFIAHVLVLPGDPTGPRQLVATTSGIAQVAADYVVSPNPLTPAGANLLPVFGR